MNVPQIYIIAIRFRLVRSLCNHLKGFHRTGFNTCLPAVGTVALAVTACSGRNSKPDTTYIEGSVEELYNRGMDLLLSAIREALADT